MLTVSAVPRRVALAWLGALPVVAACSSEGNEAGADGKSAPAAGDDGKSPDRKDADGTPDAKADDGDTKDEAADTEWGQMSKPPADPDTGTAVDEVPVATAPPDADTGDTPIEPTPVDPTPIEERPMATKYGLPPKPIDPRPAKKYGAPPRPPEPRPARKYGGPPRPKPAPEDPLGGL